MGRLIDADKLSADMYHEAFVKDSDMQKWDSGCWIRYKMFENVLKAQPAVEPESISKWKKEFREYVDSLDIARDDWKGIIEYIDELPSAESYTTTHDSISAKTGKNDGDRTSGDCISRQAVTKFLNDWLSCLFENCHKQSASDLKMIIKDFKNLPSAQPELKELSEWKADFKGYINALNMPKDDYDGIMEYIDDAPTVQPYTTTHDSIPAETGKNDGDGTSGDCISRTQAAKDIFTELYGISAIGSVFDKYEWADICETTANELPSIQPERKGTRLSTVCLLCKKPAVTFNTEDDIPYTNYSYCEDCLRKGLKLLREQKKNLQAQPERKTGRWIPTASGKGRHECSRCHEYAPCYQDGSEHLSTFCVLCGAKMERGEEE